MRECKLCGSTIPSRVDIDGKVRNLKNRKFCLECSPFGLHNTSKVPIKDLDDREQRRIEKKRNDVRRRRETVMQKSLEYKGGKCSVCGYSRCVRALQFHHVDPKTKLFAISDKAYARAWDIVKEELDKCVLLCANCHAEVHSGMIDLKNMA